MKDVFRDMIVFFDDILIYSPNLEIQPHTYLRFSCTGFRFHKAELSFLGFSLVCKGWAWCRQYLRDKRFNSRQAWWSITVSIFTYQLPDQFEVPKPILPSAVTVAPEIWDLDSQISRTMQHISSPHGSSKFDVPTPLGSRVVEWAPTSLSTGYPLLKMQPCK